MTNHNFLNKLKTSILIILTLVFVLSMSLFTLTACDDEEQAKEPNYTYSDVDSSDIPNADFTKGTANKAYDAYPIVSANDWTKAYHNQSISSYVDSGVIDVSSNSEKTMAWDKTREKLLGDKDLLTALSHQTGKSTDEIKNNFDNYLPNPGTHEGAVDGKMYMLNNYPQNQKYIGKGTAQSLTSSKSITLEKGKIAKISVWVKTANITGHGDPANRGANISLTNSINSKSQSQFRLTSIISNEWTQYTIYVKADASYNSTLTLVLGLGYGLGSNVQTKYYTQGTVYFDDVSYELVDSIPTEVESDDSVKGQLLIGNEDTCNVNEQLVNNGLDNKKTSFIYDMSLQYDETGLDKQNINTFLGTDGNAVSTESTANLFTTSNVIDKNGNLTTSKSIVGDNSTITPEITQDYLKLSLVQASASIKTNTFSLENGKYSLVSFNIINDLKDISKTNISVDVWDVCEKQGVTTSKKIASILSFDEISTEVVNKSFLIYNNFPADEETTYGNRSFYVVINVGPNDLTKVKYANDFATGTVTISGFTVVTAYTPEDNDEKDVYDFITSTTSVSKYLTAGYDGYTSDSGYTEKAEETDSYKFNTRPGDFGTINTMPADVKGYDGVHYNHVYVNSESAITELNTRSKNGDANGNYAGLVNSKNLADYSNLTNLDKITDAIGSVNSDTSIQPLMIYNNAEDSYGYIGEKITVEESSYAKISLKVRVFGDATAYIYLVDVSKSEKTVLTFDEFTPNGTKSNKTQGTLNSTNNQFVMKVDSTTLGSDEWVTISFFIATGATEKNFRLEMWNGSRDGNDKSTGYVFFDEFNSTLTSAFTESDKWENVSTGHPLYEVLAKPLASTDVVVSYEQPLTETEIQFNEEYANDSSVTKVKYYENYIWAKTSNILYAVFNSIDPVEKDPYDAIPDEEESDSGCTAETDPSTFWLSFSSILLGVCLVLAIIALFLKMFLRKRKANKNDAKSHYTVTSRIRSKKNVVKDEIDENDYEEEIEETELEDDTPEDVEETEEQTSEEQNLDEYVYGEVIEDFTEETNKQEESSNENQDNE